MEMSKIDEMIERLCPDGVEYRETIVSLECHGGCGDNLSGLLQMHYACGYAVEQGGGV